MSSNSIYDNLKYENLKDLTFKPIIDKDKLNAFIEEKEKEKKFKNKILIGFFIIVGGLIAIKSLIKNK